MKSNKFHFYYELKNIENFNILDFTTGAMGDKGPRGKEGDIGKIGPPGGQGKNGLAGDKGEIGPKGIIGINGPKGDKGITGSTGKNGKSGMRGERGDQGPPGPPGDPGPQGPVGFQGKQGNRGSKGSRGDNGKRGDGGYDGLMSIDYSKCVYASLTNGNNGWNYNHSERGIDGNRKEISEIICPVNTFATELETQCYCIDEKGRSYEPGPRGICIGGNAIKHFFGMSDDRDCKHRLKCCPINIYDYPEKEKLRDSRINLNYSGIVSNAEEERIYNIMWISMEPINHPKKLLDYPEIFDSEVGYNQNQVSSNDSNNIDSALILPKTTRYNEIPITNECDSERCSLINQICSESKVCLNENNPLTGCRRPPCWHPIPEKIESCPIGKCNRIGQFCERDGGRICMDTSNIDEECIDPPCWNKIPLLSQCKGTRCVYEGQQCSGKTHDMNFPGFICLNKKNENYVSTEQCIQPPCWHKIDNVLDASECTGKKCNFVGQKCRLGGTDENPLYKICLDKEVDGCNNPPCWIDIPQMTTCPDVSGMCPNVDALDLNGNPIRDSENKIIRIPGPCEYKGSCPFQGQMCRTNNSTYDRNNKKWINVKECVNSYRTMDSSQDSVWKPSTCDKKPCWLDTTVGDDALIHRDAETINNYNEDGTNIIKSDNKMNDYKSALDRSNLNSGVYKFTDEDREGYLTKKKLQDFMTQNWMMFEANVLHVDTIWNKFSKSNMMDYKNFTLMMRSLYVETFKFRGNKRLVPRPLPNDQINSLISQYGMTNNIFL